MDLFHAIVLAIVQGATEFLPVSSSAHLRLVPELLHWEDPGLTFDVALHVGTLIAVVVYFFKDWLQIIGQGFGIGTGTDGELRNNRMLLWFLLLGSIPGAIAGLLFEKKIDAAIGQVTIGIVLIVFSFVMWAAERWASKRRDLGTVSAGDAFLIGCFQALAIFPGVSRSGSTISAGLFLGMNREAAARFSFLLATPIIAGAALKKYWDLHKLGGIPHEMRVPMLVGIAVSAVVGALVIGLFLNFLRRQTMFPFVVYRVVFGIIVIALAFLSR